jgi:hypothetical protein
MSAGVIPVTIMAARAWRSSGALRAIGVSPTARHGDAAAKSFAGGASQPRLAQHAMLEDMPQRGSRRTFEEFRQQKRHVVVGQFAGRRKSVESRQEAARNVLAAAGFLVEQA